MKALILFALLHSSFAFGEISSGEGSYNSYNPYTYDVCAIQYTMQHYMQGRCFEVVRPVRDGGGEMFKLRAVQITHDLQTVEQRPSMILIPGGPGESSGPLRYALNIKDVLNSMSKFMGVNTVMYDPRGTGTSVFAKPVETYDTLAVNSKIMTEDLKALADTVSPKRPVILWAHSAGGSIALRFAQLYPDRVSKIILISAVVSPRQMAELDLASFGAADRIWQDFAAAPSHKNLALAELSSKYHYIEDVLRQQLKARIMNQDIAESLKTTPLTFRERFVQFQGIDESGVKAKELIETVYQKLSDFDKATPLVPASLRQLKIPQDKLGELEFKGGEWIKAVIACGEGATDRELAEESIVEGAPIGRLCNGFHVAASSAVAEIDLRQIKTPVLFLAGRLDVDLPLSVAQKTVSQLPNAQLIVDDKSGHVMFVDNPHPYFVSIDAFLAK